MSTNLTEDFFFDGVALKCPNCASYDVAVYKYLDAENKDKSDAYCGNCQVKWSMA